MKIPGQFRQGDLLITKVDKEIPKDAEVKEDGVALWGEVTGHAHKLSDATVATLFVGGAIAQMGELVLGMVEANEGASFVHDEHHEIKLPAGNYVVSRQREYTPEGIRMVQD